MYTIQQQVYFKLNIAYKACAYNLPPPSHPTQLRASFTKLIDSNNNYNLSNLETDLDLSKPKN